MRTGAEPDRERGGCPYLGARPPLRLPAIYMCEGDKGSRKIAYASRAIIFRGVCTGVTPEGKRLAGNPVRALSACCLRSWRHPCPRTSPLWVTS